MKKTEWKTEEKRHQNHREFGRRERLIKHAIEIFDLVDITPAAMAGKVIDHRFLQSGVLLAAAQYGKVGVKRKGRRRALALDSRVC